MGLFVGSTPVKSVYVGSTPVTAVYVGPQKVWPTIDVVQITLGTGYQARDQFRAALTERGLSYQTVTEVPFDIELVGSGSTEEMFYGCFALTSVPDLDTSGVTTMSSMFSGCSALTHMPDLDTSGVTDMSYMLSGCSALTHVPDMDTSQVTDMRYMLSGCSTLTHVPDMDTSQVTNMSWMFYNCAALTSAPVMDTGNVTDTSGMFYNCAALTHVPDLDTSQVTNAGYMFYNCSLLTDGNVRLIGRHPDVNTNNMITGSGLTREPFYMPDGTPDDGIIIEVHQVSVSGKSGTNTAHPLLTVTVPAGETWSVRVQGTMQSTFPSYGGNPQIRIGSSTSSGYGNNATVDYSGTITSSNSTIALITPGASYMGSAGFTGTVSIEK